MNTYKIEQATHATLPDVYALHDPADAAQKLPVLQKRIAEGKSSVERFWLLRSARGVEGVASMTARPSIPLFPRYRADTPAEQVTAFLRHLKALGSTEPEQHLVRDSQFVTLDSTFPEAAGWVLNSTEVVYQTDLSTLSLPLSPDGLEGGEELLRRPDVQALLRELDQSNWERKADWTLAVLPDADGKAVAIGAFGPSARPGWASLDLIGVHPEQRGKGYGTRLHAHLLARAAEHFEMHAGGTERQNHAMRRIFQKNGSKQTTEQMSFRQS